MSTRPNAAATPARTTQQLLGMGLFVLAVAAVAGMPAVLWFLSRPTAAPLPWSVMAACSLVAIVLLAVAMRWAGGLSRRLADGLAAVPGGVWAPLVVGLLARWLVLFGLRPTAASDGATYLKLAAQLAADGSYGTPGWLAFWPPGLPLLLVPWTAAGLPQPWMMALFNGLVFVATLLGARQLLRALGLGTMSGWVSWALALWPSLVLCSALPEKELVIGALLPWMAVALLRAQSGAWLWAALAGLLMGMAVLVQPSLQLLPVFGLAGAWLLGRPLRPLLGLAVPLFLAMAVTIAPWTLRNLTVFGQPLMVSSNGGDVLYRANNELATGVYIEKGRVDLDTLPELERSGEGKRLAMAWIQANPVAFAQLSAGKLMHFMGDDSYGVFAVFKRGGVGMERTPYLLTRQLSAVPWLALWVLLALWLAQRRGAGQAWALTDAQALVAAPVLYLAAIHAVFESGPRYHLPLIAMVLVLAASLATNARPGRT